MKLYQIKIGNAYVRYVSKMMESIDLTTRADRMRHISEEEKDFVLTVFPYAEVKSFDVLENKGMQLEIK